MGMNTLMLAINKELTKIAKLLIDYGVNIEQKLNNGTTALMIAADKGQIEIIQYLISHRADVNAKTFAPLFFEILAADTIVFVSPDPEMATIQSS